MTLAQRLVEGVDVWINTPRRPWEASGTSGMKVLVNGGLNVSVLDGWWAEAFDPQVGWAIGDGREHGDDPAWDRADAEALYQALENEIIPEFYKRDDNGVPRSWIATLRQSMAKLTPEFSANRTVRQYTEQHYIPAASAYARRACSDPQRTAEFLAWKEEIAKHWDGVHFGAQQVFPEDGGLIFEVEVHLGGLTTDAVKVELYADSNQGAAFKQEMSPVQTTGKMVDPHVYRTRVKTNRAASDFTARILPNHALSLRTEIRRVVWQR
jgi:starch phosphorylase